MPIGIWDAAAAQHSQSFESWFAHVPGLVVVCPSTPHDVHGLLRSTLASDDPVVFMEHKTSWGQRGEVDATQTVPLGVSVVRRAGRQLTIVSWSRQTQLCAQACEQLAARGVDAELIDLRTIWPWDRDAVLASLRRTGALLVVHEAVQVAGFGAEVVASVAQALPGCRVARLGAPRIPVGYSPPLEAQARIDADAVVGAALELLR